MSVFNTFTADTDVNLCTRERDFTNAIVESYLESYLEIITDRVVELACYLSENVNW